MSYAEFIEAKRIRHPATGLTVERSQLSAHLFGWQADVVMWALRKGRACLFEDCGLGKTIQQLEWARLVPGDVLILTPLAVAEQTAREAAKFGIAAGVSNDGTKRGKVTIANYEKMHKFDLSTFGGLVLDESSILKNHTGSTRQAIIEASRVIPYRLACTATPAPNDHVELGNHSEFVGALPRAEMLARFFVHDGGETDVWRLKRHAEAEFWAWVASWAVMLRSPADLGCPDGGYDLPPLELREHIIDSGIVAEGELFALPALTLTDQRTARKNTLSRRVAEVASMVNASTDQWIVWCELNAEGDELERAISGCVHVAGKHNEDERRVRLDAFATGAARVLVTKPGIAGFGTNWQHCHKIAFVGLSHSWEQFYQAVRRCWRFGQTREVIAHIVSSDVELGVLENIKRKQGDADRMVAAMVAMMGDTMREEVRGHSEALEHDTLGTITHGEGWTLHHNDVIAGIATVESETVGYSVFSPPFASLYTYTDDLRDMGNCANDEEFFEHMSHLIPELYRVTKPGRLVSFHCMDLPTTKERDGFIGLRDFRGELIRAFQAHGWILHSQVVIWKDPVTAMQRTKALGLLYKQLRKDSTRSRQGIPDYLVTMAKPGTNDTPVSHDRDEFTVDRWQRYASPVWMDINPSNTLQFRSARENDDERHICPLQLDVIERAMELWSAPGDLVLSPFAGIGSEGHVALKMGRRFIGFELKGSYFRQACGNLRASASQLDLLGLIK